MNFIREAIDWAEWHLMEIFVGIVIALCVAVIAIVTWTVVANESNKINEGVIVDKYYKSASTQTYYILSPNKTLMPSTRYAPESFHFTIKGKKDGKEVEYTFDVTEEDFSSYEIGDYYKR